MLWAAYTKVQAINLGKGYQGSRGLQKILADGNQGAWGLKCEGLPSLVAS